MTNLESNISDLFSPKIWTETTSTILQLQWINRCPTQRQRSF